MLPLKRRAPEQNTIPQCDTTCTENDFQNGQLSCKPNSD